MDKPSIPIVRVSDRERQDLFNNGKYYERRLAREFTTQVFKEGTPQQGLSCQPGTVSQMVRYIDVNTGQTVAEVHQYLQPDGTLAASGMPDPKMLVKDGIMYRQLKGSKDPPE